MLRQSGSRCEKDCCRNRFGKQVKDAQILFWEHAVGNSHVTWLLLGPSKGSPASVSRSSLAQNRKGSLLAPGQEELAFTATKTADSCRSIDCISMRAARCASPQLGELVIVCRRCYLTETKRTGGWMEWEVTRQAHNGGIHRDCSRGMQTIIGQEQE